MTQVTSQEVGLEEDDHLQDMSFNNEEFTEEDVLPFLLQAQDIISKLESRVVELELDLSTIHRKYEYDRNDWLVGLSQKDQYIHYLSSKLQKLEFNSQQAIVQLSDINMDHPQDTVVLCLNYLRQTQQVATPTVGSVIVESSGVHPTALDTIAADPIVLGTMTVNPLFDTADLEEGELERRQAATSEWQRHTGTSETSTSNSSNATDINNTTNTLLDTHPIDEKTIDEKAIAEELHVHRFQPHSVLPAVEQPFCLNCKQLLTQLDQQIEQKAYLKRDLGSLATALAEEEQLRGDVEHSKEALEEEVQEIATALFDTLNRILMDEVMNRDGVVRMNRDTRGLLDGVLASWDSRESQLKDIKELLVELDSIVHQSANTTKHLISAVEKHHDTDRILHISHHRRQPSSLRYSVGTEEVKPVRIDGVVLDEFQQHLKALSTTSHVIPSTPFMKRVMAEDIDPCLFQNAASSWWTSPWFKRKLMDAISRNKCEIQSFVSNLSTFSTSSTSSTATSPSASHISNSTSSSPSLVSPMPPKAKCACCGLLRVCEFKMRLQPSSLVQQQPWLPIDRFCRDRLVAVCDFYSFMSYLRQGLLQHSATLCMFKQSLHFRRRMALAKVGSMALFEEQTPKRHSRSTKRESIVLDHSGSGSDTASVVSMSDIQGLDGTGQIVIVH
ncbi:hypothetical protein BDF14DRAFT_1809015 [Spinellus fusiger]|nr:hypothetical protein BDF14DRAFT_1809015 [Spinellus fusiger]